MTRIARTVIALILLAGLAGAVYAQEPASPPPLKSVVAVFARSEDVEDSKIEKELQSAFAKTLAELTGAQALDLQAALSPTAKTALKKDGHKRLLELPELMARTDRVRRNLQVESLLLAEIEIFGKYGKSYFISMDLQLHDLRNGEAREFDLGTLDAKSELERGAFVQSATASIVERIQRSVPGMQPKEPQASQSDKVVCNTQSKLFHRPTSHHLPPKSVPVEELERSQAVKAGYKPCPICFPELRRRIDPESTEAMLGAEVAGFIEYYYRVSANPELHGRLERVGRQVLASNRFTKRDYIFTALNSEEINAFAAPGGYVYVTSGMLDAVESDDELACVLAHEIAHVEQEHGVKQYRRAQKAAALGVLVSILSGQDMSMLAEFVRELVMRGYDRRYEKEADRYGYMYMRRTSFDPESDLTLLGKLQDMELSNNVKIASWLRTHPKADDRVKYINEYKADTEKAAQYLSELDKVDPGLAAAVRENQLRYVDSVDRLKSFVESVKVLP